MATASADASVAPGTAAGVPSASVASTASNGAPGDAGTAQGNGAGAGAGAGATTPDHVPVTIGAASGSDDGVTTRTLDDVLGQRKPWYKSLGNVSNMVTFVVFVIGLVLVLLLDDGTGRDISKYVLSVGLFGFAGACAAAGVG